MDPKVSLLISDLIKNNIRYHLLAEVFTFAGIILILIVRNKITAAIWSSLWISIVIISCGILAFHFIQILIFTKFKTKNLNSVELYLSKQIISLENLAAVFQKASLIGLLLILVSVFFIRNVNFMGAGMAILGLFGIEFILHRYIIWIFESVQVGVNRIKK